ncbi:MAG: T9SS type A sorting domain-containing protein [Candidatus Cloacimonetes bacterium]|nr:T9SS type A sorting domain-containing protein [Candidatus Cloacimonadota bacterium]MCF7813668.1 T9SS type A sorting domain-containing protein [Candidatus Cloacimonadota bacterium]MCF7867176.1 T9SS type A sorting domain-containing protein [Candidatus Cloacimonadota bacterium]MCF7882504.1 T9SS type A sorting domain-containing protein [Candidatus Cloacimonadota bacterium]
MKIRVILLLIVLTGLLSAQVALDPRYHTYDEAMDEIFAYQDTFPDLVKVEQIGNTLGAYPYQNSLPIYAVKLSNNVQVDEDEPEILFLGPCHSEEILGIEINMFMLQEIIQYRNVQPFSVWLDNLEIWIVPTYNPEGLQVVMDDWDETFRKNKRDNNGNEVFDFVPGSGGDIDGVDPNRNYSFNWIHGEGLYQGQGEEWNDYYRGPFPFSEGESQTIRDFAAQHHFIYSIAWHSSRTGNLSEKVFHSFKWEDVKACPDLQFNKSIGDNVAALIENEAGTGSYESYSSQGRKGGANDWFYKTYGTVQLLIECGTQNMQPNNDPPLYLIDDTCERNRIGAYYLMNRALGYNADASMLTGIVTDATTGDPLVARYSIDEKEAGFFDPRFTDELYGRYWRPISVGTYNLRINKKGYEESVTTITVNNSQWTTLNIQLTPLDQIIVNAVVESNGTALDGTIMVGNGQYIEEDILDFTGGSLSFDNYVGEHEITVMAAGYVPQVFTVDLTAGVYDLNIEMSEAETIFNEDFESNLSAWNVQGDWALTENSTTGTYSVTDSPDEFYQNGTTASLTLLSPINLTQATDDVVIELWHKYHTEHDYDFCHLEYSLDGSSWINIASFDGFPDEWSHDIIPIPELTGENVYLRFILSTDDSVDDPGWWIDQIKILASDGAGTSSDIPPARSELFPNFPNPFNPETHIKYDLANSSQVELSIFNLKGQKVRALVNEFQVAGNQECIWNGKDDNNRSVASGVYFYTLKTHDFSKTHKMVLLK